jgi:hypothetical protein
MDLPATGQFRLLLPSGQGHGMICSSELLTAGLKSRVADSGGPALLRQEFTFDVAAGRTTILPTIAFVTQGVEVRLQYKDQGWAVPAAPSATGAEYWIEGVLRDGTGASLLDLARIQDSATAYGLGPIRYDLQLRYGPAPAGAGIAVPSQPLLVPAVPVNVSRNQTTVVTVDLSHDLGVIQGGVTLNGAAPGPGLSLCVSPRTPYYGPVPGAEQFTWCMDLPATGQFRLLLPSGQGHGMICSSELLTAGLKSRGASSGGPALLRQEFTFDIQPGKTILVSPAIGP